MPIEDGINKATKNLDKAAEAAPTSEVADSDDFGLKDKASKAHGDTEDDAAGKDRASGENHRDDSED